jgi:hypothetical protein
LELRQIAVVLQNNWRVEESDATFLHAFNPHRP